MDSGARHLLERGRRWHLAVDGGAHELGCADRAGRRRPAPQPQALYGVDAAAAGGLGRRIRGARPVPVLRDVRSGAGAHVPADRGLGLRGASLRRHQVLHLHDGGLGAAARGHRGHRRARLARQRHHVRPADACRRPASAHQRGPLVLPGVRDRLSGEGAGGAAAHLAARRAHRSAHGGLGGAGSRAAEAGHLRSAALRSVPVPRGVELGSPGAGHRRRGGCHLGRDHRGHAARPQTARGVFLGGPHGLHRAGHLRLHRPGHRRRRHPDGQPRHQHRCLVPARGDAVRASPNPPDRRAGRHPVGSTGLRRGVHADHAVVGGRAGPERVRRRVPDPDRIVRDATLVDDHRRNRGDPRRAVPAVGISASVSRTSRSGGPPDGRSAKGRAGDTCAVHHRRGGARRVPQTPAQRGGAGCREVADSPRRSQRLRPPGTGRSSRRGRRQ